jgi:hypothetical protein
MTLRAPNRGWFPVAVNHRGNTVIVWLWAPLLGSLLACSSVLFTAGWAVHGGIGRAERFVLGVLAGAVIVSIGGLYDDFRPASRGLRHQLGLLLRGRLAPGVVKMVAVVGASTLTAWLLDARAVRFVIAVPLLAGCANLWNLLDVQPGRSLKWFLLVGAALWPPLGLSGVDVVLRAVVVICVPLLLLDLLEVGMLGDAGANVLGFLVGVGSLRVLSTPWLGAVLAAVLVLHVLAETVTLSRLIDAVPPLRWLDRVGRRRAPASSAGGKSSDPSTP